MEYSVLLERLFEVGINGKLWRLLKNWYEEVSCYVKIDGKSSEKFKVERGVRQGSILSPSLFLLVMDPLLRQLESSGLDCPSITTTWGASCMQMTSSSWPEVQNLCNSRWTW